MIDVGDNHQAYGTMAEMWGVAGWQPPETVLPEVGVRSERGVKGIFITHAHFDHMGTSNSF